MGKKGDNEKLPDSDPLSFILFMNKSGIQQRLLEGGRLRRQDLIDAWEYAYAVSKNRHERDQDKPTPR